MSDKWIWHSYTVKVTVNQVKSAHDAKLKKKRNSAPSSLQKCAKKKVKRPRHMAWDPTSSYTLIRAGIPITKELIVERFNANTLSEKTLYIFKSVDPERQFNNHGVPKYEAVFMCVPTARYTQYKDSVNLKELPSGAVWVRAQKQHLKQIYINSGRVNARDMDMIMEDNSPYWVDRHRFRMAPK